MLQIKVLSPLMINANDLKKDLLFRPFTGSFVPPLTSPLLNQLLYNGSRDTEGQGPSQNTHL